MHIKVNRPMTNVSTQSHALEAKTSKANDPKLNAQQQAQKLQNLAVINSSINANIKVNDKSGKSVANNPMALLYKTAIEEINKQLEPILGKNSVQSAYESNLDVSPEGTADRIVNGATGFYNAFKAQDSQLSDEASLTEFLTVIGSGIDQGFAEAKDILDSLSVLDGEIESNIDLTYDFVQQGLADFKTQILANLQNNNTSGN